VCAGLTNQPLGEAKDLTKRSRGELPLFLARHTSAAAAVEALLAERSPADYNGSWLLVGDRASLFFVDFTGAGDGRAVALPPGIHVLENKPLGEPSAKVDLVRSALEVPPRGDAVVDAFRRVLADHRAPVDDERPNAANCVHLETFGTRSSCIVRVPSGHGAPGVWVADGPPCTTGYEDAGELWVRPAASRDEAAQSRTSGL
jgi:uncharacterized protein with NRDE domain